MHIKRIHDTIEKMTECVESELNKGIQNVSTREMGEVVDMIKDLSMAEYYARISAEMEKADWEHIPMRLRDAMDDEKMQEK